MKITLENAVGYIIVDDNTGKILSVFVSNAVDGKFDARTFSSYTNHSDGTHTALDISSTLDTSNVLYDEEESNRRMAVIGQNGNTGEHYKKTINNSPLFGDLCIGSKGAVDTEGQRHSER